MVFGRQKVSRTQKHPESDKEDPLHSKANLSQQELPPAWRMQQSIGNYASNQLLQQLPHSASMLTVTQGLPLHLQQFAVLIASKAEIANQQQLWKEFELLSVGQRYALLHEWYGKTDIIDQSPNWKELQQHITSIKHVQLQPEESKHEADITLLGAAQPQYDMNTTGLLFPYREAWIWLNYKGNKQGKADLLQHLDQLSVPQKKLLLHKINGRGRLTLYRISNELTIEKLLKQWVDWDRLEQLLMSIEQMNDKQIEQQLQSTLQEQEDTELSTQTEDLTMEDKEEEEESLFGLFLSDAPVSEAKELTLEERLKNPAELFRVLFGLSFDEVKKKAVLANQEQLIDRVLNIDSKLPPKQLEQERKRKLKEQGFANANQFFMWLKLILIELLFNFGVKKKDEKFTTILQKLELGMQKQNIQKEQIAARIHSI